jgi:hypothetical protein
MGENMNRKNDIGSVKDSLRFTLYDLRSLLRFTLYTSLITAFLLLYALPVSTFAAEKLLVQNGRIHVGTTPNYVYGDSIAIEGSTVDNASAIKFIGFLTGNVIPSADTTKYAEGLRLEIDSTGPGDLLNYNVGSLRGAVMLAGGRPANSKTINSLIGGYFVAAEYGASGGTITSAMGGRFGIDKGGSATITNAYGVYIDSITGATNNYAIYAAGGAYSDGTNWYNASSREYKENIRDLTSEEALLAFNKLNPVSYNYKVHNDTTHVGFIAEDVPALVASKDRKGLSPMDIVAVLTKVIQEQEKTITELSERVQRLEKQIK